MSNAPVVEASTIETFAADTSHDVTPPAGIAAGDVLALFVFYHDAPGGVPTPPSGFTLRTEAGSFEGGGSQSIWAGAFDKVADSGDETETAYTFSQTNSVAAAAVLVRISGAETPDGVYESRVHKSHYGSANAGNDTWEHFEADGNENDALWITAETIEYSPYAAYAAGETGLGRTAFGSGGVQAAWIERDAPGVPDGTFATAVDPAPIDGSMYWSYALQARYNAAGFSPELHSDEALDSLHRRPVPLRRFRDRRAQPEGLPLENTPDTDPEDVAASIDQPAHRRLVPLRARRDPHRGRLDAPDDAEPTAAETAAAIAESSAPTRRPRPHVPQRYCPPELLADSVLEALTVDPSWQSEPPRPRVSLRRFRSRFAAPAGEPIPGAPISCPGTLTVKPFATVAIVGIKLSPSFGIEAPELLSTVQATGPGTLTVRLKSC